MNRTPLALLTILVSILASVATVKFMSRSQAADVTAHSLTLVDSANHEVAKLSSEHGVPALVLFDKQHRKRAAFFLEEESGAPDIYLYDTAGAARAALNLFDSGIPNLTYTAASIGDPFAITEYTPQGNFILAIEQVKDNALHKLGTFDFSIVNNQPQLKLTDQSNRTLWKAP